MKTYTLRFEYRRDLAHLPNTKDCTIGNYYLEANGIPFLSLVATATPYGLGQDEEYHEEFYLKLLQVGQVTNHSYDLVSFEARQAYIKNEKDKEYK